MDRDGHIDRFRMPGLGVPGPSERPAWLTRSGFLKGPVPVAWLTAAGSLHGKALQVGIILWFLAGRRKRLDNLKLNLSKLNGAFGFDRSTASRALLSLERAGLVSVHRARGACARVTLLPPDGSAVANADSEPALCLPGSSPR